MKKAIALLLAMTFILASVPALALEQKYMSSVLFTEAMVPDTLEVLTEFPSKDRTSDYIYYRISETDKQIVATLTYVPEYVGLQGKPLPAEEVAGWKAFFTDYYPNHSQSTVLKPKYNGSQRIYRYYGMNSEGIWMLSYTTVLDGLYICVCCEAERFGYYRSEMRAIFEALNISCELFAKAKGVSFERFSPDDYEVEIFNLLYDDSPTSIFRNY